MELERRSIPKRPGSVCVFISADSQISKRDVRKANFALATCRLEFSDRSPEWNSERNSKRDRHRRW